MNFHVTCKIQNCLVLLLLLSIQHVLQIFGYPEDDEAVPDFPTIQKLNEELTSKVREWGFQLEINEVYTEDNYIIKIHRLFLKKEGLKAPVYLMHGINGCCANYLAYRQSLAFYLAERGYDVWVGNARGTAFSSKHKNKKKISYNKKSFWKFSWHEYGYYDVPAIITHVKKMTGAEKIHYVGMSMGTTVFLVMGSTRHQFLQDLATVSLMAPIARPKHFDMILSKTNRLFYMLYFKIVQFIGHGNIFKFHKSVSSAIYKVCSCKNWVGHLCEWLLRAVSRGTDLYDFANSLETYIFFPCGASIKSYAHFIQLAEAGTFQQYDYGTRINRKKYRSRSPPEYDLPSIDKTIYMLVGGEDTKADKKDVIWLNDRLQDPVYISANFEQFDHRDFEYSIKIENAHETILNIIEAYEKGTVPNIKEEILIRDDWPHKLGVVKNYLPHEIKKE